MKLHLLEAMVKTNGKMSASKAESCKNLHVTIHELVIQGESWYILVVYIDKEKLIRVKIDDLTVFLFHIILEIKNSTSAL